MSVFRFGEDTLTPSVALQIVKGNCKGIFSNRTRQKIAAARAAVESMVAAGQVVYGINTGFGSLCTTVISPEQTALLQFNLLRSHSVGVGAPLANDLAKLMLILKAHSLAMGFSGVSMDVMERILLHIETDAIPVVPTQGSVGASGDLAPLAHLFLPLIGLGYVSWQGKILPAESWLQQMGLSPLELHAKEGLALINGTQFIAAHAVKVVERLHNCLENADIIGAMTLEGVLGSVSPFDEQLHAIRPFVGAQHVAYRLRTLLKDSPMVASHANCGRVQDPYSIRCMPQVHGASRNAWLHLKDLVTTEINSVTDNPIILDHQRAVSGGNFHGQLLALPLDYAAIAAAELGNISDRRIYLLLEGPAGLPVLLMRNTGINSGFMIPQYTSAALVSENKSLCFPASVDSIPTSLGQEDHVSMGSISGRKALQVIENLENILAIELLCAAQAFDFRRPLRSTALLEACHELVRSHIDHAESDRLFYNDILQAQQIVREQWLPKTVAQAAARYHITLESPWQALFNF
ncbi:MAG: histidine ammonia-lyase [Cytophagales bacterium]|nr:histidine ammonia-lyase [Bernardetiaceae bacterium]MDW8205391.1 histidine ammonia-lyase [Cytophagales bacterium]